MDKPLPKGFSYTGVEHGAPVEVTGTLRYLAPPPPTTMPSAPSIPTTQLATPGFYFDVEEFHRR
jgi:hypothetical protein